MIYIASEINIEKRRTKTIDTEIKSNKEDHTGSKNLYKNQN
ncbi:hypothetical protein [Clostridium gasigenes]|nr:hypothetical protein [Clostridium gasigenes]